MQCRWGRGRMAGLFKSGGPAGRTVEGMFAFDTAVAVLAGSMRRRPRDYGDLVTGSGRLRVGQGAWISDSSYACSFQGVLPTERARCGAAGTNPEELPAASYAAGPTR